MAPAIQEILPTGCARFSASGQVLSSCQTTCQKWNLIGPLFLMMSDSILLMVSVTILADLSNRARQLFANPAHASHHPPECRQPSTLNSLTSPVAAAPSKLISTNPRCTFLQLEDMLMVVRAGIVFELRAGMNAIKLIRAKCAKKVT